MARQARISVIMIILLTLLVGVAYPLFLTGIAQLAFPGQANGGLVYDKGGKVIGSSLIGQNFAAPRYFHPRPSAAGPNGYDATASGGSNLGPTNSALINLVGERAAKYRQENGLRPDVAVPVDAVTTSASGLDPQISLANALLQAPRVAKARDLPEDQVKALVMQHLQGRAITILGDPGVNVLELNLALDGISAP
ncbi:MAG: K(+)-transporting ATPase subunit C [Chloroflexota bacterium]